METKIELKIKTFEYIRQKLHPWYNDYISDVKKCINEFKCYCLKDEIKLSEKRRHLKYIEEDEISFCKEKYLIFIFLIIMAAKKREKLLNIFDNFIACDQGIIEKDIFDYYPQNHLTAPAIANINISADVKHEIDEAIMVLKERNHSMIGKRSAILIENSVKIHTTWMYFFRNGEGQIPIKCLLKEKSIYSNNSEFAIFG